MTKALLSAEWLAHFAAYRQLIVGFSGGLDSTVLLHILAAQPELRPKLIACHINHGISPYAAQWQEHCAQFCHAAGIRFITETVHFDRRANLEEAARVARYKAFTHHMTDETCLVLGHHLDDQAETVLLQLFRGAGVDGLAAMTARMEFANGELVRPLLTHSRQQLEQYANAKHLNWIDDESNYNTHHARNYLRNEVIPLLQKQWPGMVGNVARTALHCQDAKANLYDLAMHDCPLLATTTDTLAIALLSKLTLPRQINVLRTWLQINKIQLPSTKTLRRLIVELMFAAEDATPEVSWGNVRIRRYQQHLILQQGEQLQPLHAQRWLDFPNPAVCPGYQLLVREASAGVYIPNDAFIEIKPRQGGEKIYLHGQSKSLKKLLQQWNIPPWIRKQLPLVYINHVLAVIPGYAISDLFSNYENNSTCWQLVIKYQ